MKQVMMRWAGTALLAAVLLTAVGLAAEPVKLVYVPYYSGARLAVEQAIVERFNATHPGIQVEVAGFQGKSADQVLSRLSAGEQLDVGSFHFNLSALMYMGHTLDLTNLVQQDRVNLGDFRPGSLKAVTYGGRILGLPFGAGTEFVYANLTLLAQAGIAEPKKGWRMDDLQAYLPKLTRTDSEGKVSQWALGMNSGYPSGWAPFYLADGGDFVDDQGMLTLQKEPIPAKMDWAAQFLLKGQATSSWGGPWRAGQMALLMDWEGRVPEHLAAKLHDKFDWKLLYVPVGAAGPMTVQSVHATAILRATKHPREAWEFLKYFVREGDALFGENFLYPSTLSGARALLRRGSEALPSGYDVRSFYAPVLDPPARGLVYPSFLPGWIEAERLLTAAMATVTSGQKPAATALAEVVDQMNVILANAREQAVVK